MTKYFILAVILFFYTVYVFMQCLLYTIITGRKLPEHVKLWATGANEKNVQWNTWKKGLDLNCAPINLTFNNMDYFWEDILTQKASLWILKSSVLPVAIRIKSCV